MADRAFQHDLGRDFFDRLSGASDAWDEGAGGSILTGDAFEAQASGGDLTLSVTEGADSASVVVGESVVLAATEQPDTVTVQVVEGANLTLSVTEASDTATASVEVGSVGFALSATEQADSVSFEIESGATSEPITTAGAFFGLPPPPKPAEPKTRKPEPIASVPIDEPEIRARVQALAAKYEAQVATRALATVTRNASRQLAISQAIQTANQTAQTKAALAAELDRIIAVEIERHLAEIDDEEVLLLAA